MKEIPNHQFLNNSNNERIGSQRLILIETLCLIIQNDKINEYKIINEIKDDVWDLLFCWFKEGLYLINYFYLIFL